MTEDKIRGQYHQDTNVPRSNPAISQIHKNIEGHTADTIVSWPIRWYMMMQSTAHFPSSKNRLWHYCPQVLRPVSSRIYRQIYDSWLNGCFLRFSISPNDRKCKYIFMLLKVQIWLDQDYWRWLSAGLKYTAYMWTATLNYFLLSFLRPTFQHHPWRTQEQVLWWYKQFRTIFTQYRAIQEVQCNLLQNTWQVDHLKQSSHSSLCVYASVHWQERNHHWV